MAMRFDRLDLNLLVALDTLLTERSVSLAADRLCLSQSATSSALSRLRDYFGDELLVISGRRMVLTRRAESLILPVKSVLEQIRSTIALPPKFDPASSDRLIRVMASDYTTEVVLEEAIRRIAAKAPGIRFEVSGMTASPLDTLERNGVDLLIWLDQEVSPDHPSEVLFEDDYVVLGAADNPAFHNGISTEDYLALGHVVARFGDSRTPAFEEWFLRRSKRQRRIEVMAASFTALPGLVAGTARVATIHRRIAERLNDDPRFVVAETPFAIPSIREVVQWHASTDNDAAQRWVIEQLQEVAHCTRPMRARNDMRVDTAPTIIPLRMQARA